MKRSWKGALALLIGLALGLAVSASAAPDSKPPVKSGSTTATTQPAKKNSTTATAQSAKKTPTATGLPPAAPRTLEDIHIEGEIPVPQVLFITARDQRRFTQFHHRRYLKSSLQVGEQTVLPSRVAVSGAAPAPAPPVPETPR